MWIRLIAETLLFVKGTTKLTRNKILEKRKRIQFLSPGLIKFSYYIQIRRPSILSYVRNISFFHLLFLVFLILIFAFFYSYNDPL